MSEDKSKPTREYHFKQGVIANPHGRPKGTTTSDKIQEEDRNFYGTDSKKFLERALLKARTWEEGLKFAKELRLLQHPSLQSIQTRVDNVNTITLRWSSPDELPSNERAMVDVEVIQGEHADGARQQDEDSHEVGKDEESADS